MSLPTASDPNSMLTLGSLALASFPDSQASVLSGNRAKYKFTHDIYHGMTNVGLKS